MKRIVLTSVCLLTAALQGCGENTVATECYQLQEAMMSKSYSLGSGTVTPAFERNRAQASQTYAATLSQVELSDEELIERRESLVALINQQSDLYLQSADILTEDGIIKDDAAHDRLTAQEIALAKETSAAQNGLQIHCSLQ